MGAILALAFVPFATAGFNIALAMRLADFGRRNLATFVLTGVPILTLGWVIARRVLIHHSIMTRSVYAGAIILEFCTVAAALYVVIVDGLFKKHVLLAGILTTVSLVSILAYAALL
ncbi:MAG: hypothetical protein AAGI36_17535 [Pseudomonadota bacterium]